MKKITVTELTTESFAPYGRIAETYKSKVTKSGQNWKCCSPVDFIEANGDVGIGIVYSEEIPDRIEALERHVSREEVLWAGTEDLIMLADIPAYIGADDARPSVKTTKAFHIKAGQVIIINRGTWHSPAFALKGQAKYYFMIEWKRDLVDQEDAPWISFEDNEEIQVELQ